MIGTLYITLKDYKRDDARGKFDIPRGTHVEERGGLLWHDGNDICGDHSRVMREYFARDDDGLGFERGALSQAIIKALEIKAGETREGHNRRWETVWNDEICQKYKKNTIADHWLWSIEFFNAPINDLKYIAELVGAKV